MTGYHEMEAERFGPAPEHELEAARMQDEYEQHRADLVAGPVVEAISVQTDRLQSELMELREDLEIRGRFRGVSGGGFFVLGLLAGIVLVALL